MATRLQKIVFSVRRFLDDKAGQDLVEYAMLVALICFGATAGLHNIASGVNKAFNAISTTLGTTV